MESNQNQDISEYWSEIDKSVFVPDDIFYSFHNVYDTMKDAQRELQKVRDEMKPIENI